MCFDHAERRGRAPVSELPTNVRFDCAALIHASEGDAIEVGPAAAPFERCHRRNHHDFGTPERAMQLQPRLGSLDPPALYGTVLIEGR
jgi:hypothetical protein